MSTDPKDKKKGGGRSADLYRIPEGNLWANAWKITLVVALVGAASAAVGASGDPRRFAFSYLFAFMAFLTIALGAIFFVAIQFLTVAGWSVTVRRTAEFFAAAIPVFALLFVPIAMNVDQLYEWATHEHQHHEGGDEGAGPEGEEHALGGILEGTARAQEHAEGQAGEEGEAHEAEAAPGEHHTPQHALHTDLLDHKSGWLNPSAWYIRALLYFLVWMALALFYFRRSTAQDVDKKPVHTVEMQRWAPLALVAFGLTLTFAAFDWVMSLEPTWYSTIYGVYVFAGATIAIHALVTIVTLGLKSRGLLGEAVNVEHYHDLGKMTFGFIVFHAYVGFSQMMLQWYANIPEEIVYYHVRWHAEGWKGVSYFLAFGHFALPFLFLISRVIKRRLPLLAFGCMWMLVVHVVDIYWFVMPPYQPGLALHWLDIACLFAVGGTYLTVVLLLMRRYPLIPLGDPRLPRALGHVNA